MKNGFEHVKKLEELEEAGPPKKKRRCKFFDKTSKRTAKESSAMTVETIATCRHGTSSDVHLN
jgi:hypothetical protein